MVLCDAQTFDEITSYDLPCPVSVLCSDRKVQQFTPVAGRRSSDLIHVLYTSGSTGKPKGVMLTHSTTANLLGALTPLFQTSEENVLCTTNLVFDTFITETLLPLALGKCVVMADEEEMMLPYKIAELIKNENSDMMQMTPSRLQMCLGNNAFFKVMSRIKVIILVGEALSNQLLHDLQSTGCQGVFNLYGPTEAAVYVTLADLTRKEKVTIGKPLANCRVYVLNKDLMPSLPTAFGELYLAGSCLADGYINQPELTTASFVDDPFFPGEKMYRSGDIGRLLPNGDIDYQGRRDSQVKINGQRIELSEIIGAITGSKIISEGAVIPVKQPDGNTTLSAYIVPKEINSFDISLLKKYLASQLPQVMIPSDYTVIDSLPKTATGKADLQSLASIQSGSSAENLSAEFTASSKPTDDMMFGKEEQTDIADIHEQVSLETNSIKEAVDVIRSEAMKEVAACDIRLQLIDLWKQTLHKETIKEEVSFFDQGGSSLGALNLLSQYFNNGWAIALSQFYENPTIKLQTVLLENENNKNPGTKQAQETENSFKEDSTDIHYTSIESIVEANEKSVSKINDSNTVLLTGATGFLGAHLLKSLFEIGKGPIICLVRGGNAPRLNDTLCWYFGQEWTQTHWSSIKIVAGDISLDNFGMDQETYDSLSRETGIIVHAAADVRHYANDTGSYDTNCQGTANIISFAWASSAPMMHISTVSVSGEYIKDRPTENVVFDESCEDIGQNWQDNVYVRSKFLGEQLVLSAVKKGLKAKIFRIGRLVGRDADGVFQRKTDGNTFYQFIKGLSYLDMLPRMYADFPVEMTPVDFCAYAIVALMNGKETIYHVWHPAPSTLEEVTLSVKGYPLSLTNADVFQRHLIQIMRQEHKQQLLIFMDVFNRMNLHPVTIKPSCERTERELNTLGIYWPKVNIKRWLQAFINEENIFSGQYQPNIQRLKLHEGKG